MKKRTGAIVAGLSVGLATFSFAAPAFAEIVKDHSFIDPSANTKRVNFISFNDFHGRLSQADLFAATIFRAEQGYEGNDVVISNGDAVGASTFESNIQQDEPTIKALKEIGVDAWAAGNHEFDKGAKDFYDRIAPHETEGTGGVALACNVVSEKDGSLMPGIKPYMIKTLPNGIKVAVIGAVTSETKSLTSPKGTEGWKFENPVVAVNKYVKKIQALPANEKPDIIIASFHEGGPVSDPEGEKLAENEKSPIFKQMVTELDPAIDAITTGHTHVPYVYETPVPGNPGKTRPVVEADHYAARIAQFVFTLDEKNKITGTKVSLINSFKYWDKATCEKKEAKKLKPGEDISKRCNAGTITSEAMAQNEKIKAIQSIIKQAKEEAAEKGKAEIGKAAGIITRASKGWPEHVDVNGEGVVTTTYPVITKENDLEDRLNASSLGDLVAQSMVEVYNNSDVVKSGQQEPVDASLMNPGGLRADLDPNGDGIITYKEAADVLPFANTLNIVTITGKELHEVLAQQWQYLSDGKRATRPYLQLGISDDLTYTSKCNRHDTMPGNKVVNEADRLSCITGVYLKGKPVTDDQKIRLIMPSFLAAGGDNFYSLQKGTLKDAGLADLGAFVDWVKSKNNAPLQIDNSRQGFIVEGVPAKIEPGKSFNIHLEDFDKASAAYVQNSKVEFSLVDANGKEITLNKADFKTVDKFDGKVDIPASVANGKYTLKIYLPQSKSVVYTPLTVAKESSSTGETSGIYTGAAGNTDKAAIDIYDASGEAASLFAPDKMVRFVAKGFTPGAEVEFVVDGKVLGTAIADTNGVATLNWKVPANFKAGKYALYAYEKGHPESKVGPSYFTVESGQGKGGLAQTGAYSSEVAAIALAILALGGAVVFVRRRQML